MPSPMLFSATFFLSFLSLQLLPPGVLQTVEGLNQPFSYTHQLKCAKRESLFQLLKIFAGGAIVPIGFLMRSTFRIRG